jgi:hypothetical protein
MIYVGWSGKFKIFVIICNFSKSTLFWHLRLYGGEILDCGLELWHPVDLVLQVEEHVAYVGIMTPCSFVDIYTEGGGDKFLQHVGN